MLLHLSEFGRVVARKGRRTGTSLVTLVLEPLDWTFCSCQSAFKCDLSSFDGVDTQMS